MDAVFEQVNLGEIGGEPADQGNAKKYNAFQARPVVDIASIPSHGFSGQLLKSSPVADLQRALADFVEVPVDAISLAYEGRDLQLSLTLRDNGISEPGPAARKAGVQVQLVFTLASGVLPGKVLRAKKLKQEQAEEAARAAEAEALRLRALEEARRAEERRAAEARAQAEREEEALREQCSFRVQLFGGSDFSGVCVRMPKSLTVGVLVRQLMLDQGIQPSSEVGIVLLTARGQPLTVQERVEHLGGSRLKYYAETGPEKLTPGSATNGDRVVIRPFGSPAEADRIEASYRDS